MPVRKISSDLRKTADRLAVFLARQIKNGERVFHGVASTLPLAAVALARRTHAPQLTYLNIPGGVDAHPFKLPTVTTGAQLNRGASSVFSLTDIFDLSSSGGLDLAFLSGAEIDTRGDINLSFIGDPAKAKVRFPGGAGSAVILPTAKRTVLWRTVHDSRSFPERCGYVTASGRVDRVVTPLCIFRMVAGRLCLESRHAGVTIKMIKDATGFALNSVENVPETPEPSSDEIFALESVDPEGVRFREFF